MQLKHGCRSHFQNLSLHLLFGSDQSLIVALETPVVDWLLPDFKLDIFFSVVIREETVCVVKCLFQLVKDAVVSLERPLCDGLSRWESDIFLMRVRNLAKRFKTGKFCEENGLRGQS